MHAINKITGLQLKGCVIIYYKLRSKKKENNKVLNTVEGNIKIRKFEVTKLVFFPNEKLK